MKDRLNINKAQDVPKQGYMAVKDNIDAIAPMVRRVIEDRRTREALRDLVGAGREVRDELKRDGGKIVLRDLTRRGDLTSDLEGSAKVLHTAAAKMSKARGRERRRRSMRLFAVVGTLGAIIVAVRKALAARQNHSVESNNGSAWAADAPGAHDHRAAAVGDVTRSPSAP